MSLNSCEDRWRVRYRPQRVSRGRHAVYLAVGLAPFLAGLPSLAASQPGPRTLTVVVVDSATGLPIGNARVRLRQAGVFAISSDSGTATLPLHKPGVVDTIEVIRIGYSPLATTVGGERHSVTEIVFELQAVAQLLPTVISEAEQHPILAVRGFYDRKKRLRGTFIGPAEISQLQPSSASDIMRTVPGAIVTRNSSGGSRLRLRSVYNCPPHVYLDGARFIIEPESSGNATIFGGGRGRPMAPGYGIDELSAGGIAAVEVYTSAAQVPPEYNMTGSVCGVVLFWTGAGAL